MSLLKDFAVDESKRVTLSDELDEKVAAYVLVTCGPSSEDGKIQVEMTYQGDPAVISYLLAKAKDSLDNV